MKKLCPASTDETEHYTTDKELSEHNGVCKKCHNKFSARHKANKDVKKPEYKFENGVVFADGHAEQGYEERGDPLCAELEGAASNDRIPELSDALATLLAWCWKNGNKARTAKSSYVRFIAISAVVNPALLNNKTYKEIGEAQKPPICRAYLSEIAVEFQREFGVHFRRSRRASAYENFRNGRLKAVAEQKK